MKHAIRIVFSLGILGLTACTPTLPQASIEQGPNPDTVHSHAGFLVYVDGQLQDFSELKYMHIKPCDEGTHEEEQTPEEEQEEKAHLHDGNGDVVHVHRPHVVWQDLFTNLQYTFPEEKKVTAYQNGVVVENIFQQPIRDKDSIIIVVGDDANMDLGQTVSQDRIQTVAQSSESCGK